MKRLSRIVALCACLVVPSLHAVPPPGDAAPDDFVPHEIVVRLRPGLPATGIASRLPGLETRRVTRDLHLVRLQPPGALLLDHAAARASTLQLLERVRRDPDIALAQPNYVFRLAQQQMTPDDPLYPAQWHYPMVRIPEAWAFTGGGNSAIRIAILDNGKAPHPDLDNRWSTTEYNATAGQNANEQTGWRHGLHVAAIAGGETGNRFGGAGICFQCTLLNVKVANGSDATTADVVEGLAWAADHGARVVNLSLAYPMSCMASGMQVLRSAIADAIRQNIVVVAAAGNVPGNVDDASPASCPAVISVAAADHNGQLAAYSGRGANIGITAPGGGGTIMLDKSGQIDRRSSIYGMSIGTPDCLQTVGGPYNPYAFGVVSAWNTAYVGSTNTRPCHRYLSGTSMATPHVSGTVGLMLSAAPALTPAQVLSLLQGTATPMPACHGDCGPGLLDAHLAVVAACARNILCPY